MGQDLRTGGEHNERFSTAEGRSPESLRHLPADRADDRARREEAHDIPALIEETIFYPSIKRAAETREIVLEGFEEHHVIKMLLKELEAMPVDTEEWAAKVKVLQENVEHHVEEEEGEMFQKARDVLSEDEINQLGEQMEEMKKQLQQQMKKSA